MKPALFPEAPAAAAVFMRQALELAARARGRTSPNPMVGAIVVREGQVVGTGYHHRAGEPHAEVLALREAGELARGATLYVTLEPCSHFGRTPPCAPAVAEAGVAEVYAAMEDPNPLVAGAGLRYLAERGIEVHTGLHEAAARLLNEGFVKRVTTGVPFVEVKVAMTLDGKIATSTGRSRWITGEPAREWVHRRRDQADAVLVGANTVRLDNPQLTVRPAPADGRQPLRCVVTASGDLPANAALLTDGAARTLVFHPAGIPSPAAAGEGQGEGTHQLVQAVAVGRGHPHPSPRPVLPGRPEASQGTSLQEVLRWLAEHDVNDVLVEGGATLNAALLRAGLVDRVSAFVAPKLFGGDGRSGFGELGAGDPAEAIHLEELEVKQIGQDWLFRGRPIRGSGA